MNAHEFIGLTPGQILGSDHVSRFLTRFCRSATEAEVAAAGADPLAVNGESRYRYLLHSPPRRVTIPGFSQSYSIHMSWKVGMIIDANMIQ